MYAELAGNRKKCRIKSRHGNNLRKQKDRLDKALPSILEGYCEKSSQPREVAEQEAKEFLQVIEDSASYQFGLAISPFFVNPMTQGCASDA